MWFFSFRSPGNIHSLHTFCISFSPCWLFSGCFQLAVAVYNADFQYDVRRYQLSRRLPRPISEEWIGVSISVLCPTYYVHHVRPHCPHEFTRKWFILVCAVGYRLGYSVTTMICSLLISLPEGKRTPITILIHSPFIWSWGCARPCEVRGHKDAFTGQNLKRTY